MSVIPSLLQAIIGARGEALVLHAEDKPYVVAAAGHIEIASRGLSLDAVNRIVAELLPAESLSALDGFGAVQHDLPAMREFPGEQFTQCVTCLLASHAISSRYRCSVATGASLIMLPPPVLPTC